jgi:hypothetical protein
VTLQFLAGLDQREGLGRVHPERFQHGAGQKLAHPALEGQPAVGPPRPGGAARPLGAEIEEAAVLEVVCLREEKAAPVPEVRIVAAELVAVIAQRQRGGETARQRLEAGEMGKPLRLTEIAQPHALRPALVAIAQQRLGEPGGPDRIVEIRAEPLMGGGGRKAHGGQRRKMPTSSTWADQANWSSGVTASSR